MKTIVAQLIFQPSLNAANYAADMACVIGADLALLHVYSIPVVISEVPVPAYSLDKLIKDAEEQMKQLKEKIMFKTQG